MEEDEGETVSVSEVAPALIAVHPLEESVAVAVGSELRVFDLKGDCPVSMLADSGGPSHSDTIRSVTFCPNGSLFASAGDDKLVKIWRTDAWSCIRTVCSEKRVSSVAISCDGLYVAFADKFGLVWLVSLCEDVEGHALVDNKPVPILGHYCSIITSMKFSPDGRFIATADRDFKIRITLFPKRPLKGAHEIQSFCLGHTDYVSCLAFAYPLDQIRGFLLSGSGDSSVRLWNFIDGNLLDTCEIGAKVITMEKSYIPTSLALSSSTERLWTVMGASKQPSSGSPELLTCLRIMSGFRKDSSDARPHDPVVLQDNEVPGGEKLLLKLQGSLDVAKQEEVLQAAAAALKVSMHNMLIKKQYSVEKREARKSSRNDKKLKK